MKKPRISTAQKTLFLLMISAISLLLGLSYVVASDDSLFLEVPDSAVLKEDASVAQARRVKINWSLLENIKSTPIDINLFDGTIITAVHEHTYQSTANEGYVWTGYVVGEDNSVVTLSVVEDILVGSIILNGIEQYTIGFDGQWQVLRQIDANKIKTFAGSDSLIPPLNGDRDLNQSDLCEDGSRVDLLIAYTTAARIQEGGTAVIEALLNNRVANMNWANESSGLSFKYRLVHTMESDYVETEDVREDLDRLSGYVDRQLTDVIVARDQYLADLTSLVVSEASGDACGVAYTMNNLSTDFAYYALNVTALDYAGPATCDPLTLAHEIGHNMGNNHNRSNTNYDPLLPYAFGYQSPYGTFRTIMAYNCPGTYCPRYNFWSNSDGHISGEPTGIDHEKDPANSADNARSMAQTAYYVANFRQNCETIPAQTVTPEATATSAFPLPKPTLYEIDNGDANGNFTVAWSAIQGATRYLLTENFNNSSWNTIYEGPALTLDRTDMIPGAYCYNVRAFGPSGRSDWSGEECTTVMQATPTIAPDTLAAPVLFDIENSDADGNYVVKWSSVTGAERYRAQENHNDTVWITVYEGPNGRVNRNNLPDGRYCYRVRAINFEKISDWSAEKCTVSGSVVPTIAPTPTTGPLPLYRIFLPLTQGFTKFRIVE